jgi:hypothetical protein
MRKAQKQGSAQLFIGRLGDPNRLLRCPALFYEFQEIGLNENLGTAQKLPSTTSLKKIPHNKMGKGEISQNNNSHPSDLEVSCNFLRKRLGLL